MTLKNDNTKPVSFSDMIAQAYKDGQEQYKNHTSVQLLELPEQIKRQSLIDADMMIEIEKLRLSIDVAKNTALELVLCATVTENGKTKEKYSNDKARNIAVQQLLRDDAPYLRNINELGAKEVVLRKEQIQLDYLQNQFRAYIAIAGMNGVR